MGRRFGQHFLSDPGAISAIVEACRPGPRDVIVEVGPGRGAITRPLAARAGRLIAVEIDPKLCGRLRSALAGAPNAAVVESDFLKLPETAVPAGPVKFVGNLPYDVAGPILRRILGWPGWSLAVVMLQLEVADRILASPGNKAYGPLTLETALKAAGHKVLELGPGSFDPPPKVSSAVLSLSPIPSPIAPGQAEAVMKVVHAAFGQRRKTLANSLASVLGLAKGEAVRAIERSGLLPSVRAEDVPLKGFLALAQNLPSSGI